LRRYFPKLFLGYRAPKAMSDLIDLRSVSEPKSEAPIGETALGFLQAVYRDLGQPLSTRLRAAIEALPFESPKLSAIALGQLSGDFSDRLERAIWRSRGGPLKVIEHRKSEQQGG
jgi:hypothetical protein